MVDGAKVSDWLDGYHWGIKELRDNDSQWKALFESISHYLRDRQLRRLTEKHIDVSLTYNSVCLGTYYSGRFPKSPFSLMLHETLVGSPISPEKAEMALSELLSDIEKRLAELQEEKEGEGRVNAKKVVEELLSIKDYPEKTIYILRVLYHDRQKLTEGLYSGNATPLDNLVYQQLSLYDIVRLEQRKERIYGSDNTKDVGYRILTERGKEVIKYLQKNQQVLDKVGVESDEVLSRLGQNGITRAYIVVSIRDYRFVTNENGELQLLFLPRIDAMPAVRVEDIVLEIKGERLPTTWQPMDESRSGEIGHYIHADVPTLKPGSYQARVIACIDNKDHPSDPFIVEYRQSNPSKPNYRH